MLLQSAAFLKFPAAQYPLYVFSVCVKFYNFIANNEKFVDNFLLYCVCRFKERENFPPCILCGVGFLFMRAERLSTAHTLNNFFLRYLPREQRGRYRFQANTERCVGARYLYGSGEKTAAALRKMQVFLKHVRIKIVISGFAAGNKD